jgi:hypothetical protein
MLFFHEELYVILKKSIQMVKKVILSDPGFGSLVETSNQEVCDKVETLTTQGGHVKVQVLAREMEISVVIIFHIHEILFMSKDSSFWEHDRVSIRGRD